MQLPAIQLMMQYALGFNRTPEYIANNYVLISVYFSTLEVQVCNECNEDVATSRESGAQPLYI